MSKLPNITTTSDGPRADGASPQLLAELLEQCEKEFISAGVPLDRWLAPGIGAEEVNQKLAEVGLIAPDELLVWFGWHNGLTTPTPGEIAERALPNFVPASIDLTIRRYKDLVLNFEPPYMNDIPLKYFTFGAGEGWLRIEDDSRGCAVDCSGKYPPSDAPRIRYASEQFYETGAETLFRAVSLCTRVTWMLDSFHSGAFNWNAETQWWDIDFTSRPDTQRASLFS